jgi:hypothetical protein
LVDAFSKENASQQPRRKAVNRNCNIRLSDGEPQIVCLEDYMRTDPKPLSERASEFYSQLSSVANELNAVSDELGKSITQIDAALKKLNLGITVWVAIQTWSGHERYENDFWSEELGYAKINGKWGVSLKRVEGNFNDPDAADVESWLFNDAPRTLRLGAIAKIPELLENLATQASIATKKIQDKLADAQAVAAALNPTQPSQGRLKVKGAVMNSGRMTPPPSPPPGYVPINVQATSLPRVPISPLVADKRIRDAVSRTLGEVKK